jgi:hypothetical protein
LSLEFDNLDLGKVVKTPERKNLTWRDRVAFGMVGLITMLYGYGQELRGKWIYSNWRGLDLTARFVMAVGALFVATALFPWWSRIHFLWDTKRQKRN